METTSNKSTHTLLGYNVGSVGVIQWHDNEFDAWQAAKIINSSGGKVKVVPVINGNLNEEHQKEKNSLFEKYYKRLKI